MNDMYYFINECQLYGYVDYNTLSKTAKNVESLTRSLDSDAASTLSWFENNHMCANPDKFQAIVLDFLNPPPILFIVFFPPKTLAVSNSTTSSWLHFLLSLKCSSTSEAHFLNFS